MKALPDTERLLPWALRVLWVVFPFTLGPPLAGALHSAQPPVRAVASGGLWAGWAVGLVATLVPHPLALTAVRVLAPAAVVAALAAAVAGEVSALAVGWAGLVMAVAFAPETSRWFVNGPAYPNEGRYPLRMPGPLLLGPLELAWALAVGLPVAAALLLAGKQWVAGGLALVLGAPVTVVLLRSLHGLSRRWVVFVPAGLVLHDPLSLADPVLFRRQVVEVLRPAPAGCDSLDLTQGATGLALELVLREKVAMVLTRPGRRGGEPGGSARLMFTPTRPGAVLAEAERRRIPVG